MKIDRSDEQEQNADSPKRFILLPVATLKCPSFSQPWKQKSEIVSSVEGMKTD
jgi:hypothetical protein